ncbi:uncharacterized protein LOC136025294 isoform X2 [Artemia franciscana]|uniref:uncharacterized protein LOC136025294 isoform X2 n=1 Tax=Artemia franciscana TaxID=6661 RepID=UPI0032DAF0BA
MLWKITKAVVSLLFTSLLVRCQVHQSEKCDRYSPEEAYYGIIRPAAVGVIEEMETFFNAVFFQIQPEHLIELMPQISPDSVQFQNLSKSISILEKYEYAMLKEVQNDLDGAWNNLIEESRNTVQQDASQSSNSLFMAMIALTDVHDKADKKLDEVCKELSHFFHGIIDQVEGLTIFLENEAITELDDERKLASELQKMVWKKTTSNLLGLVVSRSLHRILKDKLKASQEPHLLKPINEELNQIAKDVLSLKSEDKNLGKLLSHFWEEKIEHLYQSKKLRTRSRTHLEKLHTNNEYIAEVIINMVSYY